MSRNYIFAILAAVLVVAAGGYVIAAGLFQPAGSAAEANGAGQGKLQATASFYPLYYFASRIGGPYAEVYNLTPVGAEPHDFDPTTQDIARIERGDMLILNGGVEPWGDKIREELKGRNVKVVVAGEGLLTRQVAEEGQAVPDPHVWLSPRLARQEAAHILEGFRSVDAANSAYYESQAKSLEDELDTLDASYRAGLAHCRQKDIVTSHAAFAYLADSYGLTQVPIAGLSPDAEPSARDLAEIVKLARQKQIKYIFFESLVSPRLAETIATEIGARTMVLDPLEGLTDEQIRQGKTYFTVMQDNLRNLETALECTM